LWHQDIYSHLLLQAHGYAVNSCILLVSVSLKYEV
jgi:hypothetical protein